MMQAHDNESDLIDREPPAEIEDADILDENEEYEYRDVDSLFDHDVLADDGELDYEDEPSW